MKVVLGTIAVVVLAVVVTMSVFNRGTCAYYGYQTDRETRYAVFVGCMVKVHDKWIPRNELRVTQ